MKVFTKQPNEVRDIDVVLTDWITGIDTVLSTTVSAPSGLTVSVSNDTTTTPKVWVSDGIHGQVYKVTVIVSTADGRVKEVDFQVSVRDQ